MQEITMNRTSLDDIVHRSDYFGATIGRFGILSWVNARNAFRIKHGEFSLGSDHYTLATNSGNNHNHGGVKGFDKVASSLFPSRSVPVGGKGRRAVRPHLRGLFSRVAGHGGGVSRTIACQGHLLPHCSKRAGHAV